MSELWALHGWPRDAGVAAADMTREVFVFANLFRKRRFLAWLAVGGVLLQSTGCSAMAAQVAGGILAASANTYVRSVLSHWLNISGSSISL